MPELQQKNLEVKQGVIQVESESKTHLRVNGLRGMFRTVTFDDNFNSTTPVAEDIEQELSSLFGKNVERIEPPPPPPPIKKR